MSVISDLADAITRQEGPGAGTAANRYNNPGNLMDPNNRIWPQYPKSASGEVIFPDYTTGRSALENDLSIKVNRGMTLTSLLTMYAPPSQNDTAAYIEHVSAWTGLPANTPLNQIGDSQPAYALDSPDTTSQPSSGFDLAALLGLPVASDSTGVSEASSFDGGLVVALGIGAIALWLFFRD